MGDALPQSIMAKVVLCVLMLLGATSFIVHQDLFKLRFKEMMNNLEFQLLGGFLLIGLILGILSMKMSTLLFRH